MTVWQHHMQNGAECHMVVYDDNLFKPGVYKEETILKSFAQIGETKKQRKPKTVAKEEKVEYNESLNNDLDKFYE